MSLLYTEAWVLQTWRSTGTGYAYGTRNLLIEPYLFLLSCFIIVGASKTYGRRKKITKIILLFYCILILSLTFDENSRGMHTKSKTLTQHDYKGVVIHLKNPFFHVLYQRTRTLSF